MGLGVDNNNDIIGCCMTNSFDRSGNVLGMSGTGGFGGGVGVHGCSLHSGMGVGLAGAAGLVIHVGNSFRSCGNPLGNNSSLCKGVVRAGPMLFPTACRGSTSRTCLGRVVFNGCNSNGCVGPCTRLIGKCGRSKQSGVRTRFRLRRSLSFIAGKLGLHKLFGASHLTACSADHRCGPFCCGLKRCGCVSRACVISVVGPSKNARCLSFNGNRGAIRTGVCVRTTLACGHRFKGRKINKLMIVRLHGGRRPGTRALRAALPGHGINLSKHLACSCSGHCFVRKGFNCGNSRHFSGDRH